MTEYGIKCALFRKNVLKITQKALCEKTGANSKNVSAFENGRANNIAYLGFYLECCSTEHERKQLTDYVFGGATNA